MNCCIKLKKFKRSYTLVELMVVVALIGIITAIVAFGFSKSRQDEGLNADFLEFYDNLNALKLRSNLGQLAPTSGAYPAQTVTQTMTFVLVSGTGATQYVINGVTKTFRNGTKIVSIKGNNNGPVAISFVPDSLNYQGPTPRLGSYAVINATRLTGSVPIILQGKSGMQKTVTISGSGYNIDSINK